MVRRDGLLRDCALRIVPGMGGRYRRTTAEEELARRYHIPIPPQRDLPIVGTSLRAKTSSLFGTIVRPGSEAWMRCDGV